LNGTTSCGSSRRLFAAK